MTEAKWIFAPNEQELAAKLENEKREGRYPKGEPKPEGKGVAQLVSCSFPFAFAPGAWLAPHYEPVGTHQL